jgi:hypothetical protein
MQSMKISSQPEVVDSHERQNKLHDERAQHIPCHASRRLSARQVAVVDAGEYW